jgi:NADP-dependent 3-hydroxy acid dehydrogenase YdfG
MNQDTMPAHHLEANQRQAMMRDWRASLAWEIVATALTLVMARQHLGPAVTVTVIDPAAVAQTQQATKTPSTSSADQTRQEASATTALGAAALITFVGAVVAVVTVL